MLYNILALGDVTSEDAVRHVQKHLRRVQKEKNIAFTVINGENAAGTGNLPAQADALFAAGADVITLGNHTFGRMQIADYLEDNRYILRPANYSGRMPGRGMGVYDCGSIRIAVISLIGRRDLDWKANDPFTTADKLLASLEKDKPTFTLVDFHAQATSEKLALGYYLDGRVSALWGTHTHVPTADAMVLPNGTGYVTDLGMTGPKHSVLGIQPKLSIAKFRGDLTSRYQWAEGPTKLEAVLFTIDTDTGLCRSAERVDLYD
jgi:metallophosphoesterase (TIGR00282 family)